MCPQPPRKLPGADGKCGGAGRRLCLPPLPGERPTRQRRVRAQRCTSTPPSKTQSPTAAQRRKMRVQGVPCLAWCHLPLPPNPPNSLSSLYGRSGPPHQALQPPLQGHVPVRMTNGGFAVAFFFIIESRAWRGPSQIRIRKSNRTPRPPQTSHPTESSHPSSEGPTPAPAQRPKLKRLAASFDTPLSRPLFLSATCSALPLRGVRFLSAPRGSSPRL